MRLYYFLLPSAVLLAGCATTSPISPFYKPTPGMPAQIKQPISSVRIIDVPATKDIAKRLQSMSRDYIENKTTFGLGEARFIGPLQSDAEVRRFAASVGGDLVMRTSAFLWMGTGSRMVLGSYTTPTVSYTSGYATGTSSGSSTITGQTPLGAFNANSFSSGTSTASANAATFTSGQSTYVRETYQYPVYAQVLVIFTTPQGQLRNWRNVTKSINVTSEAEAKQIAAAFATDHGLPVPHNAR